MDPSSVQIATALVIWLWPLWKAGTEEFGKQVGRRIGEEFAGIIETLLRQVDATKVKQTEQAVEEVVRLAIQAPSTLNQLVGRTRPAILRLLRDPDLFVLDDLEKLANQLDYSFDTWALGARTTRVAWVGHFVDQVWADGKAVELIQAIQQQKPHLFT